MIHFQICIYVGTYTVRNVNNDAKSIKDEENCQSATY